MPREAGQEDFWLYWKWFMEEEEAKKVENNSPFDAKVSVIETEHG